jgi:uncharacterized protein
VAGFKTYFLTPPLLGEVARAARRRGQPHAPPPPPSCGRDLPQRGRIYSGSEFWRLALTLLALAWLVCLAPLAKAQSFPPLTGRVVDAAHVLPADIAARLDQKLAALETQSQRQLVVATIPDLQGYDISDFGYRLGRAWGIGNKQRNDGIILIVAPKERQVRVEVGYGLEPIVTDGLSALIIQDTMLPKFKAGDMPGGIEAGADALIKQLTLPPDQAQQIAATAHPAVHRSGQLGPAVLWLLFISLFFIFPLFRRRGGTAYGSGLGPVMLWGAMNAMGGGRSGGGSFGGGGASGSW